MINIAKALKYLTDWHQYVQTTGKQIQKVIYSLNEYTKNKNHTTSFPYLLKYIIFLHATFRQTHNAKVIF